MLTPASSLLSQINIDYKRIELFRKVKNGGSDFRITPAILRRLDASETVDDILNGPSTSANNESQASLPSAVRKNQKRKLDDRKVSSQTPPLKCAHCGCQKLVVVDPKREDKKRLLECMRLTCLATVNFTDLPVGTELGDDSDPSLDSIDRLYPKSPFTREIPQPNSEETDHSAKRENNGQQNRFRMIFDASPKGSYINVPGQEAKARLMG